MDTLIQVATSWILPALFFWFLFSLVAMTLIEVIERYLKYRQNGLHDAIQEMLGNELTVDFYKHTLVNSFKKEKPSYISESLFAKVVMEWMLAKVEVKKLDESTVYKAIQNNVNALAQKNVKFGDVLQTILIQANLKSEKVSEFMDFIQKDLEAWFLETVRHKSSNYWTHLQGLTLGVSLVIALAANFDVINITVRLWEMSKYNELLTLGQKVTIDQALFTRLPVGWYSDYLPSTPSEWILKIAGIYLGAFFIAIGSQYIYNLVRNQIQTSK